MGGVAVLHSQDVLRNQLNYDHPKFIYNSNRRKRSPQKKRNDLSKSPPLKSSNFDHNFNRKSGNAAANLVMGKVKILKRGEALTKNEKDKENKNKKMGIVRENEDVKTKTKTNHDLESIYLADFYAGTAFDASPPPSSLPVPAFFKKSTSGGDSNRKNDDYASSDLRRLLNLDF